jgi:hypothetical protein
VHFYFQPPCSDLHFYTFRLPSSPSHYFLIISSFQLWLILAQLMENKSLSSLSCFVYQVRCHLYCWPHCYEFLTFPYTVSTLFSPLVPHSPPTLYYLNFQPK